MTVSISAAGRGYSTGRSIRKIRILGEVGVRNPLRPVRRHASVGGAPIKRFNDGTN